MLQNKNSWVVSKHFMLLVWLVLHVTIDHNEKERDAVGELGKVCSSGQSDATHNTELEIWQHFSLMFLILFILFDLFFLIYSSRYLSKSIHRR